MYELNTLLPADHQLSQSISVYSPAVTSSGDVYHIAAYYLLCEHYNWYMPKLFLAYDTSETKVHAERSKQFLTLLFNQKVQCEILEVNTRAYHYPVRNKRALEATLVHPYIDANNELVINQKMITSLLQGAFLQFGHKTVNAILRYGFKNRAILKGNGRPIAAWIEAKAKEVRSSLNGKPFIVIHNRYSTMANDGQNLSPHYITNIKSMANAQGYEVVIVNVSSEHCPVIPGYITINAFERINYLNPMYCKFQHILLLSALSGMRNFDGVIGGTSGTLDVIALMGINVLNIHNFSSNARITFTPHQDFRILIQSLFMSVCDMNLTEDILVFYLAVRNMLFAHGTLPLSLGDEYDTRVERAIFKQAYRPQEEPPLLFNGYYKAQKDILSKKSELKKCFDERILIKVREQNEFAAILSKFTARV